MLLGPPQAFSDLQIHAHLKISPTRLVSLFIPLTPTYGNQTEVPKRNAQLGDPSQDDPKRYTMLEELGTGATATVCRRMKTKGFTLSLPEFILFGFRPF